MLPILECRVCSCFSWQGRESVFTAFSTYLGCFKPHTCPLGGSKVHWFRNTIATTHFRHKGSRKTDNKLPALLYSTVHPDPLLTQDFWGDLERHKSKTKRGRGQGGKNTSELYLLQLEPVSCWVLPHATWGEKKLCSANSPSLFAFSLPSREPEA